MTTTTKAPAGTPPTSSGSAPSVDSLGRQIHPEALRALDEVNRERRISAGRTRVRVMAHVPAAAAAEYEALDAHERGDVITAGITALELRAVVRLSARLLEWLSSRDGTAPEDAREAEEVVSRARAALAATERES